MPDLTPAQIEMMIDRAAEKGAQRALSALGLQDDNAPRDIAELRGLVGSYRTVRMSILKTISQIVTAAVLTALIIGAGPRFWRGE